MLAVLFVVVAATYVAVLLAILFIADLGNVGSMRSTAVFLLVCAVVCFGALLFVGTGAMAIDGDEGDEALPEREALPIEEDASAKKAAVERAVNACPECNNENPHGANFCNACGAKLSPDSEGGLP
jgi:Double zinc ribbon